MSRNISAFFPVRQFPGGEPGNPFLPLDLVEKLYDYMLIDCYSTKAEFSRSATVGAAISRPQRNRTARLVERHAIRTNCRGGSQPPAFVPGQKCSVEGYHVRHSTNSPKLIRDCRFVPCGRLRASPTVLSWCCGNSPNPVHHFWLVLRGRLIASPTVVGEGAWTGNSSNNYSKNS